MPKKIKILTDLDNVIDIGKLYKNYMMILKPAFNKNLSLLILLICLSMVSAKPYTSQFLPTFDNHEDASIFYPEQIQKLSEGIHPQFIYYISSINTRKYQKILIKGILFTYKNKMAKEVIFTSSIDNFGRYKMERNKQGVWFHILAPKSLC